MARLEHLIFTSELKTSQIRLAQENQIEPHVTYDSEFDCLILLFVSPETETIVHYFDSQVAVLYLPENKEIVGIQIENFKFSFLPQHDEIKKVWRLSEADAKLEDLGDLILAFERKKPLITREIMNTAKDLFRQEGL